MANARFDALLEEAAHQLEGGNVIPSGGFLLDNSVTLDEAFSLINTIAMLIRGYLRLDPELRAMVLLLGADMEKQIPPWIAINNATQQYWHRRMQSGEDQEEDFFPKKEK